MVIFTPPGSTCPVKWNVGIRQIYREAYNLSMKTERPHPEMHEGQGAFDRFQEAVKAVLKVPKSALPPSPFAQGGKQRPAKATRKPL